MLRPLLSVVAALTVAVAGYVFMKSWPRVALSVSVSDVPLMEGEIARPQGTANLHMVLPRDGYVSIFKLVDGQATFEFGNKAGDKPFEAGAYEPDFDEGDSFFEPSAKTFGVAVLYSASFIDAKAWTLEQLKAPSCWRCSVTSVEAKAP